MPPITNSNICGEHEQIPINPFAREQRLDQEDAVRRNLHPYHTTVGSSRPDWNYGSNLSFATPRQFEWKADKYLA